MEIPDLKSQLDIMEVAERLGIEVNKRSKKALCPFHDDKKPSLQFSKEKQLATCFSANCDAGTMDVIGLTEKYLKLTTHEAIETLKQWAGYQPTNGRKQTTTKQVPYEKLFKLFTANLLKSKEAQQYLEERGLDHEKVETGYNKDTWPQIRNSLIFPLKDKQGKITGLYGRSIRETETPHLYNKDRKGLYPAYPEITTRHLVLTESIIDAVTLQQYHPADAILACYGTNGFTQEHEQAIQALPELESVTIFFDGDKAGREGVKRTAGMLHQLRPYLQVYRVDTPEGEDINSLVQSHDPEILTHLLKNKLPVSKEEPVSTTKQLNTSTTPQLNTDNPQLLTYSKDGFLISVLGGIRISVMDRLRVTLKIELLGKNNPLYSLRHSLDLYHDDQVDKLTRKAAERLEAGTRELQATIAGLTEALETYRLEQQEKRKPLEPKKRELTPERIRRAEQFLKAPDLLQRTNELIGQSGVVGEAGNRLILWVTYATRKRADPLHVICLGASGTGKTYLQEKVSDLVPEEDKISGTAISENALYYAQSLNLSHKLFIIEDLEGTSNILYALRELQTKKTISKMVTQKDNKGNLRTEIVTVQGPICLTATTTKERLYEDNANRCLLIYLDGSKEQQESIMADQRKRSAGRIDRKEQEDIKEFLRDVQSMYKPIAIRNPYAEQLAIPVTVFKPLRTNRHYLTFIEGVTFCHQYQREVKTNAETGERYIETTIEDIEIANRLMKDVLLAKSDELTKACRDFFEVLKTHLTREKRQSFYKSNVRQWLRINPHNLRHYLSQLSQYGLIRIIGGNKHKTGYEYELTSDREYEKLREGVQNALDEALEKIKKQTEIKANN